MEKRVKRTLQALILCFKNPVTHILRFCSKLSPNISCIIFFNNLVSKSKPVPVLVNL